MSHGFFITGTDTGVGKTLVACGLMHGLRRQGLSVLGMKPVAAGRENGRWEDVDAMMAAASVPAPREWVCPCALEEPIAPHIAAMHEGRHIGIDAILAAYSHLARFADAVVVEGVGGFLVPLNERETAADLAVRLALPVILVVGLRLGCLNHALLTADAVRSRRLRLAGWVANQIAPSFDAQEENIDALLQRLDAPFLGRIPFLDALRPELIAPMLRIPDPFEWNPAPSAKP
ncbi:MAG: dethiobiotin synthase [Betaproteobacteria bacterium]|nr:dethiobiotin synthase [Betaproteobacteria bacterium]